MPNSFAVTLTGEQWAALVKLMDQVPGLENAKILVPIYDAIKAAAVIPPPPVFANASAEDTETV